MESNTVSRSVINDKKRQGLRLCVLSFLHRCLLLLLPFICLSSSVQAQKFYNLTAEEVQIDSLLPHFACSVPLPDDYLDSVYTVSLSYPEFIDMSKADIALYDSISGAPLPAMPEVEQHIVLNRKKAELRTDFCPLVYRDGRYQILVSFMLKVESKARGGNARHVRAAVLQQAAAASRYAEHSILASGSWAKIRVPSTGVYQLTDALIKQAGFSDLSKVKVYGYGGALQNESLNEEDLIKYDDLKEVPQCMIGGKRLFHAQGPVSWKSNIDPVRVRNPYSDYGYYFITQKDGEPLTQNADEFLASFYPSADDYHILHEIDNYSWYHGGRNLYENNPIENGNAKTYTLTSTAGETKGNIRVSVSAGSASQVSVTINGEAAGSINITIPTYSKGGVNSAVYRNIDIKASNEIKITTTGGGPVRLDNIAIVLDSPKAAPDLQNATFPVPEYVHNITNQDHHADTLVDMVIIIPTSQKLLKQAERLAAFHKQHDGLRVRIVPADELYNEFSSGTPDANAYRRYLKMLYDRAETDADMPKHLLLFGDCAWDNRMNTNDWKTASTDDYLLCFESEESFSETYCYIDDGFFCLLDDGEGTNPLSRDLLDMGVGRFPVTTENDAKIMVDKTIAYANNANAGVWQNTLVFMGDDGNQNRHMIDINDAANQINTLHPGYIIKKVMWDAYKRESSSTGNTYPEVSKLIKQYQANGALIMDYAGHGREDQISHENVLTLTDFQNFTNANLPLWITASCDIMPFDGSNPTIGEAAVLNSKGGAVAFYGTTRTVFATDNKPINMAFLRHVLSLPNGKPVTLGEAQRLTKNELITSRADLSQNKLQYSLLGDPALPLNLPTMDIVIDSINGLSTGTSAIDKVNLKAGSIAKVSGHVKNADDFDGIVSLMVRDSREQIICKENNQNEAAATPFTYYDYTKTLFNGSDSVKNGRFNISFAVPKDINYSDEQGLINVFAFNKAHTLTAHGSNSNFIVGGTDMVGNDSIGPSIYCYLNSPSFVNGGKVNSTPYFVAQLNDHDGINATGNGIGHDLELIVDGEMSRTYILNDNFKFDFGSYTSGTTYYSLPELSDGEHQLLFRAWDVLNNSSTAVLTFHVERGLEPGLLNISCTKNPATTETTFIVTHDRVNSRVDVVLEVMDMGGRLLWKHEESGVSTSNTYTIDWDLTIDGGRRLSTGVYLYRIRFISEGSSMTSKAKKLIILNNK